MFECFANIVFDDFSFSLFFNIFKNGLSYLPIHNKIINNDKSAKKNKNYEII